METEPGKRPLIGITCASQEIDEGGRHCLNRAYIRCVLSGGGLPVILVNLGDTPAPEICCRLDGIMLSGGVDVDPVYYNEDPVPGLGRIDPDRDRFELDLCRYAYRKQMPLLGICRGIQVMNVAAGGTLYQKIEDSLSNCIQHYQQAPRSHPTHRIRFDRVLINGAGCDETRVNSFHHQAVKEPGEGFEVVARSTDDLVEAIRMPEHIYAVGVQWHLEWMLDDAIQLGIVEGFMAAARQRHRQRCGSNRTAD